MPFANLVSKDVFLKVTGIERPIMGKVTAADDMGLWLINKPLALDLAKLAKTEGIPGFLGNQPAVFVPFSRLEWLMTAAENLRARV